MRQDVTSVRGSCGRAADDQAHNGPAYIGVVFNSRFRDVRNKTSSAARWRRAVRIDDRLAPVELGLDDCRELRQLREWRVREFQCAIRVIRG